MPDEPSGLTDEQIETEYEAAFVAQADCATRTCWRRDFARRIEAIVRKDERERCAAFIRTHRMIHFSVAPHIRIERTEADAGMEAMADAILRGDSGGEEKRP